MLYKLASKKDLCYNEGMDRLSPTLVTICLCVLLLGLTVLIKSFIQPFVFVSCLVVIYIATNYGGVNQGLTAISIISVATFFIYEMHSVPFPNLIAAYSLFVMVSYALVFFQSRLAKFSAQLEESRERYKAFITNSNEGIWRIEMQEPCPTHLPLNEQIEWFYKYAYFAECNQAMVEMYGYEDMSDIVGKSLDFLLPKTIASNVYLKTFIMKGYELKDVESIEKDSKGNLVYFSNSLTGFVEEGYLKRAWGVQRDITADKEYIREREEMLEETKKAQRLAEIANKEKDRFLANLSHELRTPMVSILGYSNLLNENSSKEDFIKGMTVINRNAKAQLELIEDLLDVSKIVANKVTLEKDLFDLKVVIDDIAESFKPRAELKGLKLECENEPIKVFADKRRVVQIINNLVANAIKFTDEGVIKINAFSENSDFVIKVCDTGIGISEENFDRIFEAFNQVDDSSSKRAKGVGLGLSIVKNLTELHGGKVSLESELGKGSTFTVKMPNYPEEAKDESKKSLKGMKILVAEDNEDNADLLKFFLDGQEAETQLAYNAKEAEKLTKTNDFDVYLFDIAMPDEDGISLLKRLRQEGDDTPAFAVSAHVTYEKEAVNGGFTGFIAKPIDWDKLSRIAEALK